ncbi:5'-3' exonuclease PLD3-like [Schistocerca serialis cubense]|uniref:5'-3' exonuclease PLD3-like n=1 Tax=Schistocerca serialis cubense TaxID=2023355 RepID=UPI00214E5B26|nr:5'-3' exonuclease PLD3-like [Schistocerca serialis cubense]
MVRPGTYSPLKDKNNIALTKKMKPVIEDASSVDANGLDGGCDDAVAEEGDLELWDSRYMLRGDQHSADGAFGNSRWGPRGWCRPSCIPITIILILIVLVVLLPLLDHQNSHHGKGGSSSNSSVCEDSCRFTLVESIPEGLTYPPGSTPHPSTYQTWMTMIENAENSIEIASFYWTLRGSDIYKHPSAWQGEDVFKALMEAGANRSITLRIAQNFPNPKQPNLDTEDLIRHGAAEVRSVNFPRLVGGGVLHTKLWIVDRKHVYIGSANMDWRSLTQVKELGAAIYNCSCLAADFGKIFDIYWFLGLPESEIPGEWPDIFDTAYNIFHPMSVPFNGTEALTYVGSSPPSFCPDGRSTDLLTIQEVIRTAEKFIYISVMDYLPLIIYEPKVQLWQVIDDALREAAVNRRVEIRLLISEWNSTKPSMDYFLRSLAAISGSYRGVTVRVKHFKVSSTAEQAKIPFARVNHNKYMVTDNTAYIGTSNWSGDYFTKTGGVGLVVRDNATEASSPESKSSIRGQLQAIFERDWSSRYSTPINLSD